MNSALKGNGFKRIEGGSSEKENLRLLCAGHNRFRSEKTFSGK